MSQNTNLKPTPLQQRYIDCCADNINVKKPNKDVLRVLGTFPLFPGDDQDRDDASYDLNLSGVLLGPNGLIALSHVLPLLGENIKHIDLSETNLYNQDWKDADAGNKALRTFISQLKAHCSSSASKFETLVIKKEPIGTQIGRDLLELATVCSSLSAIEFESEGVDQRVVASLQSVLQNNSKMLAVRKAREAEHHRVVCDALEGALLAMKCFPRPSKTRLWSTFHWHPDEDAPISLENDVIYIVANDTACVSFASDVVVTGRGSVFDVESLSGNSLGVVTAETTGICCSKETLKGTAVGTFIQEFLTERSHLASAVFLTVSALQHLTLAQRRRAAHDALVCSFDAGDDVLTCKHSFSVVLVLTGCVIVTDRAGNDVGNIEPNDVYVVACDGGYGVNLTARAPTKIAFLPDRYVL